MYNPKVKGPHNAKWLGTERHQYWTTHYAKLEQETEARIEDLEDRCSYINKVWCKMYSGMPKQMEAVNHMAKQFKELRTTDTEKYLDALEDFVEHMEESSLYVKPK